MIQKATNRVAELVHNPWSMLLAWCAVMGLLIGGIQTFHELDKRVVSNSERIAGAEGQIQRLRSEGNADRREMRETLREGLGQVHRKLDEINRYLRNQEDRDAPNR